MTYSISELFYFLSRDTEAMYDRKSISEAGLKKSLFEAWF